MSQELMPNEQVAEQKRTAWGKIGVTIYNTEIALQLRAQEIIKTLVLPTDIKDIPIAEEKLRLASQHRAQLEEDRKKPTGRLNDVITRLMVPEKSVAEKISEFSNGLLKLKKRAAEDEKLNQQKTQELKQVVEKVRLYVAEMNAAFLKEMAAILSDSYKYALANIPPDNINDFIEKLISLRATEKKFTIEKPQFNAQYNTQEIVDAEIEKAFKPQSAKEYVEGFIADIKNKYSDYKLAWENKEQALQLNDQEAKDNTQAIDQQKHQDVAAANIQAMAETPSVGYGGKQPKEVFKLAMDETFEHANIICMAYIANSSKCREHMRITKWITGLGVKQMAAALEKIKNDDEKFDFNGLIWKKEDKL